MNIHWTVHSWANPERPWTWTADREQGGGILSAFGVHTFDYIQRMLGSIAAVCAHLSTRIPFRPDSHGLSRQVTAADCCNLLLELGDGTPVNVSLSSVAPRGKGHWIEVAGEKRVMVLGSRNLTDYGKGFGVWIGDRLHSHFKRVFAAPATTEPEDGRIAPFTQIAERFVNAVAQRTRDVSPSFHDGWRAQLVVDAAIQSSVERRWIPIRIPEGEYTARE